MKPAGNAAGITNPRVVLILSGLSAVSAPTVVYKVRFLQFGLSVKAGFQFFPLVQRMLFSSGSG